MLCEGDQGRRRIQCRPVTDPDAVKHDVLTYDEVLDKKLGVMDLRRFVWFETMICRYESSTCRSAVPCWHVRAG